MAASTKCSHSSWGAGLLERMESGCPAAGDGTADSSLSFVIVVLLTITCSSGISGVLRGVKSGFRSAG